MSQAKAAVSAVVVAVAVAAAEQCGASVEWASSVQSVGLRVRGAAGGAGGR